MFVEFEIHPDGVPTTVDTRRVTTVAPDAGGAGVTAICTADGREVVVRGAKEVVLARLGMSTTIGRFLEPDWAAPFAVPSLAEVATKRCP